MKKYLLLSLLVFIIFYPVYIHAQNENNLLSLNIEGAAQIKRDNIAVAREEAIQDALEKAILEAASKLISVPEKDVNFQLIKSILLKEQKKYVHNYKIMQENKQSQMLIININVVIAFLVLKNDLNKMGFLNTPLAEKNNIKVFLKVKDLKKYSEYVRIKEFLKSRTKLVKSIYPIRFEWQHANFEIEISGNARSLVNDLEENGNYVLEIKQTEQDKTEITCWQKVEGK